MEHIVSFLSSGALFGLAAGISPGPLLALVVSETVKYNRKEGVKVAIVPIITDFPIVAVSIFLLARLSGFRIILGIISVLGSCYVGYLAWESFRVRKAEIDIDAADARSLKKGIIANILSPHPYLFWITIGGPMVFRAYAKNIAAPLMFILGFYIFLVCSKIAVAFLVDASRSFLRSKAYVYIMRTLGCALLVFAVLFMRDGIRFIATP